MSSTPSVNSSSTSPLTITGLASGLNTNEIVNALLSDERAPITNMTDQQERLRGDQQQLQSIQTSLQSLSLAAGEFTLPSIFETSQTVSSSEPARISATVTGGAGVGGYEVEVNQLANSAQRTFTFKSPATEDVLTIDGQEFNVAAGENAKELAQAINSSEKATVYAAALENGTLVLSTRATGATGTEFIKVTDPGETLVEVANTAREGRDAEYTVDGTAGKATTNTVTDAIAGVTLNLNGLTTTTGPVTIDVQAPAPSTSNVQSQIQSFITLYNSTISAIAKQLSTQPPSSPQNSTEFGTGTLFGDPDLLNLLNGMRQVMYEPIEGLSAELNSLSSIGISTGAPSGEGGTSQAALEGQLKLNSTTLANAMQSNPKGVQQLLQHWSQGLQSLVNGESQAGGVLEARINGDSEQVSSLGSQIETLNEMLAVRQKALQQTFAALEGIMSQNQAQASWLAAQSSSLTSSGA